MSVLATSMFQNLLEKLDRRIGLHSETSRQRTIRMADIVLFSAKRKGRGSCEIFSNAL